MNRRNFSEWYWILRTNYKWTMFQSIRYALWLAR